jgi:ATP-dependent HslUV protease subunit HslV
LFSRFEAKLEQYRGTSSAVRRAGAKDWRTDRALRARGMLVVLDQSSMFLLRARRRLIEPTKAHGIGSGGPTRLAAANTLVRHTDLDARRIAEHAMNVPHRFAFTPTVLWQ